MKALNLILPFLIIIIIGDAALSQASEKATQFGPLPNKYFNPKRTVLPNQNLDDNCMYLVAITTSCQSPRSPRDIISVTFADADFNLVDVEGVNDPNAGRYLSLEPCKMDIIHVNGECINQICYLGILRNGGDGWMPERVSVSGPNSAPFELKFTNNTVLSQGLWYGINSCS